MRSDRASGRLAERVARRESEILAGLASAGTDSKPLSLRLQPLQARSVHEIAILEVAEAAGHVRYFVKATAPGYIGQQDLSAESQVLGEIGPKIAARNPRTRCPGLVSFLPEEKLLIEEFVQGQSLKSLLFDFPRHRADLEGLLALSGEWLGHFHTQTQEGCANPFDWLLKELSSDAVAATFRRCSIASLHSQALQLLLSFRVHYPKLSRSLCRVHGEFTPLHILVQGEALYVIDFGSSHSGFAEEDLARFSTFYEGLLPWRHAIALWRCSVYRQIERFLDSYKIHAGQATGPEDKAVSCFARICAMAHQQTNWERKPRRYREKYSLKVGRSWTRRRFASLARRELSRLRRLAEAETANESCLSRWPVALGADTPAGN